MSSQEAVGGATTVEVENVGGIDSTSVAFSPGVTLLVGRNATNRSSFLRAIQAVCGSDDVSLKGDADAGRVALELDGETYEVELTRQNGAVRIDGETYLVDPNKAELFAFLLGSNEARRTVGRGGDLRELVMRPVDVDEIQSEIERLVAEREEIDRSLRQLEELKSELPSREERRESLESEIESTRDELAEIEAEIETQESDLEESRAEKQELDDRLATLSDRRSDLEEVRYRLDTERESLEELRAERSELESELAEMEDAPTGTIDEIETDLSWLREREQQLESEVSDLQRLIRFNREMLHGDLPILASRGEDGGDVTEQLLDDDTVECWTCGSEVETDQIESTIERLQVDRESATEELATVRDDIEEISEQKDELAEVQRRRDDVERRLRDIEAEIDRTEADIDELVERREALTDDVSDLEAAVEELDEHEYSDVLETHKRANQLEYELGQLESDRDRVAERIAEIEAEIDRQDDLTARREALEEEIVELRTRIERIEGEVVEEFNEHMERMLDLLGYENIERIWLERVERDSSRGAATRSTFTLHVVRMSDSGVAYEDTVDHLSESERELTGLIFALAGYLAHDVFEEVPFMLLDSVEAIDADRIATIVEYLQDYPTYLLVALLPEDADAVDESYERISVSG